MGALNVALKAPVWLQMVHLLLTCAIWIGLVMLAAVALEQAQRITQTAVQADSGTVKRGQAA